jgi:hypothetical protein
MFSSYLFSSEKAIERRNLFFCLLWIDKAKVKIKPISENRYEERLKTKPEESTCLTYTVLLGELEHLKIKTRLLGEKFASVMGERVT